MGNSMKKVRVFTGPLNVYYTWMFQMAVLLRCCNAEPGTRARLWEIQGCLSHQQVLVGSIGAGVIAFGLKD